MFYAKNRQNRVNKKVAVNLSPESNNITENQQEVALVWRKQHSELDSCL